MKVIGLIISLAVMMVSCNWQRPFNRQLWDEVGDLESSPFRKEMVKDVLDNHLKPGMHYQEVKNLYQNSYWLEIIFSPDSLLTTAAYKELNNTKPIYQLREQGN